eukprot:m.130930 g.130930  ORF g.130930 m.130930 type:complete len:411 (+) comp11298_c0_seq1:356-1588(+)
MILTPWSQSNMGAHWHQVHVRQPRNGVGPDDPKPHCGHHLLDNGDRVDLGKAVTRVCLQHDGCAGQYEGLRGYLGVQQFPDLVRDVGGVAVDLCDVKDVAHHGKGIHDVMGAQPARAVRKWCDELCSDGVHEYPTGTRGFALAAVRALPQPDHAHRGGSERPFNTASQQQNIFIHIYYPPEAVDRAAVNAKEGYTGSSNDHFRRPITASRPDGESKLLVRQLPCWCPPCLRANAGAQGVQDYRRCMMDDEFAKPRVVHIQKKSLDRTLEAKRQDELRTLCDTFCTTVEEIVLIRNPDVDVSEPYWLAKIASKWFVTEDGDTYNGDRWGAGWRLVIIQWLLLQNPGAPDDVPRKYTVSRDKVAWNCNTLSRAGCQLLRKNKANLTLNQGVYTMHPTLHASLERYGDIHGNS